MSDTTMQTAARLQPAYDDPDAVVAAVRDAGPYWPIARYAASEEELAATGGASARGGYVPPWFRCDFALDGQPEVDGAGLILHNEHFLDGARQVYGTDTIVRPTTVYVNVMLPSVVPFVPHLDVPAFRGFTRRDHPVWLLKAMLESGLFEAWRVKLATAVSWFYDGPGGAFHYWPDGPERPSSVVEPPFRNVAVIADNERTYHGVSPVGGDDLPLVQGLTLDSELIRVDGGWEMRDQGRTIGASSDSEVRITLSWKGEVFADRTDVERYDSGADGLTMSTVVDTFLRDLRARGVDVAPPDDPHHDTEWIEVLGATYPPVPPRMPRHG